MSSACSKLNREKRRRAATYRRGYEDGVAAKDALSAAEPVAWLVKRYDLSGILLDTELSFTRPSIKSTCRTEMAPLYAAPAAPSVAVKALEWNDIEAYSPTGHYRVQRLDAKWEPLHNGYYMLPRMYGVVKAFDTQDEAKAHCQNHHDAAIRSALSAQVQDVAEGKELGRFELWFFHHLTDDQRTALFALNGYPTTGMDTHGKQKIALKHWFSRLPASPTKQEGGR